MRIAITAMGKALDASVDPRFGRAQFILIVDETGQLLEVVDNTPNLNAMKGAGIQAGRTLAQKRVDILMTGHCGPNAFSTLEAARIRVVLNQTGTVREVVGRLLRDELKFADRPNVEAHW